MTPPENDRAGNRTPATERAQTVLENLNALLQNIYADLDVSREKIGLMVQAGRELADDADQWPGGAREAKEFLNTLENLERKIHQTLDLKKLKEAGLVKAVKF